MNVVIVGNFDVTNKTVSPTFTSTGYWYDYFSGDSIMVNNVTETIDLSAGEYHLFTDVKLAEPNFNDTMWKPESPTIPLGISNVYPNPTNGSFTIDINVGSTSETQVSIEISDISGAVVYKTSKVIPGQGSVQINNTHRFTAGLYFVRITANDFNETKKIIIFNQK